MSAAPSPTKWAELTGGVVHEPNELLCSRPRTALNTVGNDLVEHWNGRGAWTIMPSPNPSNASLLGVACPSTTSCFAVGRASGAPNTHGATDPRGAIRPVSELQVVVASRRARFQVPASPSGPTALRLSQHSLHKTRALCHERVVWDTRSGDFYERWRGVVRLVQSILGGHGSASHGLGERRSHRVVVASCRRRSDGRWRVGDRRSPRQTDAAALRP